MRFGTWTVCVSLVVGWLAVGPARADDAAQARFHDQLAREHYLQGRYQEALREFFLEQRIAPNPRTFFNMALCFEELDATADAFLYYSEYLASGDTNASLRANVEASLARLRPKVALVEVVSDPPGAKIFVDQREYGAYGTTPRQIPVEAGEHLLWAELDGHRTVETRVRAEVGGSARVELTLAPILVAVRVEAPAGGRAILRDAEGRTAAEGPLPFDGSLAPGVYEVTVDAEGFAPWSGVLRARDGEPASLRATPVALPPPSGDVTVTASTRGAVVLLDGEVRGFAPTVLSAVPAGRHRLEVRASDTLPWAGEVEVQRDRRSWVTVSLESEGEQVERSPATWITGAIGLAGLASAGVTGFLTAGLHDRYYQGGYDTGDPALAARGRDLALATDLLAVGGSVLLATGIVLFFATETRTARVSRASVSEDAP